MNLHKGDLAVVKLASHALSCRSKGTDKGDGDVIDCVSRSGGLGRRQLISMLLVGHMKVTKHLAITWVVSCVKTRFQTKLSIDQLIHKPIHPVFVFMFSLTAAPASAQDMKVILHSQPI